MGLTINERKETTMAKVTVDRRLWLTADGKLVEDGDPKAAFLWAVAGREVQPDEAERVGYKPKTKPKPQGKAQPKAKSSSKDDTSGKDGG